MNMEDSKAATQTQCTQINIKKKKKKKKNTGMGSISSSKGSFWPRDQTSVSWDSLPLCHLEQILGAPRCLLLH